MSPEKNFDYCSTKLPLGNIFFLAADSINDELQALWSIWQNLEKHRGRKNSSSNCDTEIMVCVGGG